MSASLGGSLVKGSSSVGTALLLAEEFAVARRRGPRFAGLHEGFAAVEGGSCAGNPHVRQWALRATVMPAAGALRIWMHL